MGMSDSPTDAISGTGVGTTSSPLAQAIYGATWSKDTLVIGGDSQTHDFEGSAGSPAASIQCIPKKISSPTRIWKVCLAGTES
ncbi:hypothetical protein AAHC03_010080 [Spirometra sp. Aus1]